jgi:hypothetical protein
MGLATQGLMAPCTPTLAWSHRVEVMEAFYAGTFAQIDAQSALVEREDVPRRGLSALQQWRLQKLKRS